MATLSEHKSQSTVDARSAGRPISRGLRKAADRVPGLLIRLADRTELIESALVNAWQRRRPGRGEESKEQKEAKLAERAASMGRRYDWDAIDEASWESFPASDPPATWAGGDKSSTH